MDLQDFESQTLYFQEPMPRDVQDLLQAASAAYVAGRAEPLLLRACALAPDNLSVLVALYRFYYYQHRLADALEVAHRAMAVVAPMIGFPGDWSEVGEDDLARGLVQSFTSVRFYLLALKGAAYLNLRLGRVDLGVRMLNRVIALDSRDRLGAKGLLQALGPALVSSADGAAVSRG